MRKILFHIAACVIFLGSFLIAQEVLAQNPPPATPPAAPPLPGTLPAERTPGLWSLIWEGNLFSYAIRMVALGILSFFGWILGILGVLLNLTINYLVIGMGDMVLRGGFGAPIDTLWRFFRDLINITFVFGLIYVGFKMILDGESNFAKQMVGSIVISALLINFSLFFAKAVIDVSNIFADNIYRKMISSAPEADAQRGLSGVFMHKMQATSLLGGGPESTQLNRLRTAMGGAQQAGGTPQQSESSQTNATVFAIVYSLGAGTLIFFLAFAFGMGAFLLIVRFITLILLMAFSPIAFLPNVHPKLKEYRDKWWSTLISQAFVAPVYLFGLYVTLLIISSVPFQSRQDLASIFFNETFANSMPVLLFYAIGVALLIGTTSMAKSMSASAGGHAVTATKWFEGKLKWGIKTGFFGATRPVVRGVEVGGKRYGVLPGVALGAQQLRKLDTRPAKGWMGRGLQGAAKAALYAGTLGTLDARGRRDLEKNVKGVKVGPYSIQDEEDFGKELKKTRVAKEREAALNQAIDAYKKDRENSAVIDELKKKIADATLAEIEELEIDTLNEIADFLSNKQADHIKDHKDKFNDKEKASFKEARKNRLIARFGGIDPQSGGTNAQSFLEKMKPEDVAKLPDGILLHPAALPYLSGEVLRRMQDANALDPVNAVGLGNSIRVSGTDSAKEYVNTSRGQNYFGARPIPIQNTTATRGFTPDPQDAINRQALPF